MELEVLVSPHSKSLDYYGIYYRPKRKFNLFNSFKTLTGVLYFESSNEIYRDQPVLFRDFDEAVSYAMKLKSNPDLINEHYKEQDVKWEQCLKKWHEKRNKRNRSTVL